MAPRSGKRAGEERYVPPFCQAPGDAVIQKRILQMGQEYPQAGGKWIAAMQAVEGLVRSPMGSPTDTTTIVEILRTAGLRSNE
jgi:hypothetical protein